MTQEEKAKRYDEALERARAFNNGEDPNIEEGTTLCEYIFPELKENEDERIRKELTEFLKKASGGFLDSTIQCKTFGKWHTWLEKQGKKPQGKSALEAINEEKIDNKNFVKSIDKVESKFKEGDWIACEGLNTAKISSINIDRYEVEFIGGSKGFPHIDYIDRNFHLWTIQDAKEGDVLHSPSHRLIWIYKDNEHYHVCVNMNYVIENVAIDGLISIPNDACPATKDEQTILFAKMKEAGYEWVAKTKSLKKLPKFKVGDKVIRFGYTFIIAEVKDDYYLTKCGNKISMDNQDDFRLVPNKFDISTLVPFESKVLARDENTDKWKSDFWSFYDIDNAMNYPYVCCGDSFAQCIPYKNNEYLLGKTDDCDEFYKTWK